MSQLLPLVSLSDNKLTFGNEQIFVQVQYSSNQALWEDLLAILLFFNSLLVYCFV